MNKIATVAYWLDSQQVYQLLKAAAFGMNPAGNLISPPKMPTMTASKGVTAGFSPGASTGAPGLTGGGGVGGPGGASSGGGGGGGSGGGGGKVASHRFNASAFEHAVHTAPYDNPTQAPPKFASFNVEAAIKQARDKLSGYATRTPHGKSNRFAALKKKLLKRKGSLRKVGQELPPVKLHANQGQVEYATRGDRKYLSPWSAFTAGSKVNPSLAPETNLLRGGASGGGGLFDRGFGLNTPGRNTPTALGRDTY
jgi:hypothetical protein